MIILPSTHRPDSLRRFAAAYLKTDASLPVRVILDETDMYSYKNIILPKQFVVGYAPTGTRIGDIFNMVYNQYPNEPFYGIMADDVVPETFRWDILLKEACMPDKIAWGYDGIQNELLPCHPFIGGELVRHLGFLSVPGIKHWYVDNAWKDIAETMGCGVYLPEIRMPHLHYTTGIVQKDRTYIEQPDRYADEFCYGLWKEERLPNIPKIKKS